MLKEIRRSDKAIVAGVCGGLAKHKKMDLISARLLWVIAGILTGGLAVVAYIALVFIMAPPSRFDINDHRIQ